MSRQGNANRNQEYSSTAVNMSRLLDVDGSGHSKLILNRSKGAYKLLQDVIDCYVGSPERKECYRLTKLNEGCVYCVVRGVCLYREWEFIIDGSHYRVHYVLCQCFKSVHSWLREEKLCASTLFEVMLYFLEGEVLKWSEYLWRLIVFLSDLSESIQDVIHDSLETCNTIRNSKWNAFELVKSSASFKGCSLALMGIWKRGLRSPWRAAFFNDILCQYSSYFVRFANREGTGISANASPQMVKGAFAPPKEASVSLDWNEVEAIRTFPSAGSSFSCKVLLNRSSIKLKELPVSIRAVMLVPLIVASTMAFLNSLAVDKVEKLINDVTETEVRSQVSQSVEQNLGIEVTKASIPFLRLGQWDL
ncbi:hypothetical protein T02_16252 [Trichinella nativa]|uniref:Uncharacterized protein n=1 Tax=Trichinella nativa TaxID=6335 RepID=A0A0V1LGG1_9BILA|nr:hypothetical protein T02_16252 [Trichinella nativa]